MIQVVSDESAETKPAKFSLYLKKSLPAMEVDKSITSRADPAGATKKTIIIITSLAAILLIGLWIWKSVEINNLEEKAESRQNELKRNASEAVLKSHEEHLRLLSKPLVWAVRTEMMQGNLKQVNLYLNDLVKEKQIQNVIIANNKGNIVVATNKKFEGKPFTSVGKPQHLTGNNATVERAEGSVIILSSPIMGFNDRIGTLMMSYKVDHTKFQ